MIKRVLGNKKNSKNKGTQQGSGEYQLEFSLPQA